MLDAVLAVFLVEMNDGFGVALGAITVATSDQMLAQRPVIVDLAVEDDPDRTVFIADGLMAGGKVDDAKAAHAQADLALREDAVVVRTAVGHDVAHAPQNAGIDVRVSGRTQLFPQFHTCRCFSPRRIIAGSWNYGTESRTSKSLTTVSSITGPGRERLLRSGRRDHSKLSMADECETNRLPRHSAKLPETIITCVNRLPSSLQ